MIRSPSFSGHHSQDVEVGTIMRTSEGHEFIAKRNGWHLCKKKVSRFERIPGYEHLMQVVSILEEVEVTENDTNYDHNTLNHCEPLRILREDDDVVLTPSSKETPIKKTRKPREHTKYNVFMKTRMPEIKIAHPGKSAREYMRICAEEWKIAKLTHDWR